MRKLVSLLSPPMHTTVSCVRSMPLVIGVRRFQDSAFSWAQANKDDARAILSTPPAKTTDSPLTTLEDYLQERDWKIGEQNHGLSLVSHMLSAPLTVRYCAEKSGVPPSSQKWCFLGARAETTLPPDFWRECILGSTERRWNIDFVGPDIRTGDRPVHVEHDSSQLTLRLDHQGYFHDLQEDMIKQWGRFILFNPGLGHPHLRDNWLPTLHRLRGQAMWISAHSALDAERDSAILKNTLGLDVDYQANPFCSRIVYEDPFDKTHFVSPNKFLAMIKADA